VTVSLREARIEDRAELERFLAAYLLEVDGRTVPDPDLDPTGRTRGSLFIEVSGRSVGPCLIRVRDGGWSIAEFWVMPDDRRAGVGRAAVEALVERAAGGRATSRRQDSPGVPFGSARLVSSRVRADLDYRRGDYPLAL